MASGEFTQEYLKSRLSYDPATGDLRFKPRTVMRRWDAVWNKMFAGEPAMQHLSDDGSLKGVLNGSCLMAARAICIIMTGKCTGRTHYKDGNRLNLKWDNLEFLSPSEFAIKHNKKRLPPSGCSGVNQNSENSWGAAIKVNGQHHYLGAYPTVKEAIAARKAAEVRYLGEEL